jgi:hypothetical protein
MNIADGNIEAVLDVPKARSVASPGAACWLRGNGVRCRGVLNGPVNGAWLFSAAGHSMKAELASARRLELELCADSEISARLGLPMFQLHEFQMDMEAGQVRFQTACFDPEKVRMFAVQQQFPVSVTGDSIMDRILIGSVEAIAPFELMAVVEDPENLLLPGAIVTLQVARPWQTTCTLHGRVASLERRDKDAQVYFRIVDRQSVQTAALLAACECPEFSAHTMWTYRLSAEDLRQLARVSRVATPEAMVRALELRRDANQFYGRLREANDHRLWSDDLDENSMIVLISLGVKPVATARIVINDGDRGKSELQNIWGLPDFIWAGSFVEVSWFAIHPNFRGIGLREPVLRELTRLALTVGSRFVVFEVISDLAPAMEKIGAAYLQTTKQDQQSGNRRRVMYFDLWKLLSRIDRASIAWQNFFAPVLRQAQFIEQQNHLVGLLRSGRGKFTYRLRKILSGILPL